MLARIRKSMNEKDQGFTLIELLVVMIIIGILAAIAVPVFLNQRKKAADTATKSDMRAVVNAEESYAVDKQDYLPYGTKTAPITTSTALDGQTIALSAGTSIFAVKLADKDHLATGTAQGYCVEAKNTKGTNSVYVYNSLDGGFATTQAQCPAA